MQSFGVSGIYRVRKTYNAIPMQRRNCNGSMFVADALVYPLVIREANVDQLLELELGR